MRTRWLWMTLLLAFTAGVGIVSARGVVSTTGREALVEGAQLYDNWFAALGVEPPAGNSPLWARQTTNTRSGPDTWRCSECHGWDYKGSEGAYAAGSHYTGFPSVFKLSASLTEDEIVAHLKGAKDPSHDFSAYLNDAALQKIAQFLKNGLQDDSAFIDSVTLKAKGGSVEHGKQLYDGVCAACHGADGRAMLFRTEGIDEGLGDVANRDPYRFLHRTRFGVAGTEMPLGRELGWSTSDGRDALAYAQTLPTRPQPETPANAGEGSQTSPQIGFSLNGWGGGIITGLMAFAATLGASAFFLLGLVVLGGLVVWALRRRK